ncbi:MAG TPA: gluconate 2-dehydrogenase subunit 3 family protein [Bryobacteraceae bacterium]|nr:gluconate 2-dehydrogenase subunit 3 family protein [Bryobacteraceae bacterium]
MNGSKTLRRRRFVQAAAAAVIAAPSLSCGNRKGPWRFLTVQEATTVNAIADRLIPGDDQPGAAWAGAVNFIDRHLTAHLRKHQQTYRRGLIGLDAFASEKYGKPFVELTPAQQDETLGLVEVGKTAPGVWPPVQAREFFSLILSHTMQSFYGDPRHGGNRDAVSWRMLGVNYVPVRGRQQYDLTAAEKKS